MHARGRCPGRLLHLLLLISVVLVHPLLATGAFLLDALRPLLPGILILLLRT